MVFPWFSRRLEVGADLVAGIPVARDPVRPGDDEVHQARPGCHGNFIGNSWEIHGNFMGNLIYLGIYPMI